ncbi:MAG: lysylphosphatidylglycerol synthase transmembrane domain-containing protein [Leifsonia sp.]|uniref:lysylphosphatidylglycerol synthase transmembrane domain-containing protein n=1 Tax=Leifsonia sp. TaxID=1870902 RepID=UPI003F7FB3CF
MTLRTGVQPRTGPRAPRAVPADALRSLVAARWVRAAVGAVVLGAIVARLGAEPFLRGLAALDGTVLAAAVGLSAVATAAAAWRWRAIATRLGAPIRWPAAVGMYYRSQFLNSVLPGGVLGDVHRAVDHGRGGARAAAARAVALERVTGQAVQLAIAAVVLLWAGAAFAGTLLPALATGLAALVLTAGAATLLAARASGRVRTALRREAAELRAGLGSVATVAQAVTASVVVCACHVATFAVAASAVGARATAPTMLALGVVVLLAASLPLNIGGWGPREGAAGWAFAVAGLGADAGVATATLFGVLALLSVAPGALVAAVAPAVRRRP